MQPFPYPADEEAAVDRSAVLGRSPPSNPRPTKRRKKGGDSARPVLPSRVGGSYQRSKAPSACLVCRTRKTKCDNVRPVCGFCQSTGGDCHYTEAERSRFDPASIAILQQLDDLKGLIQGQSTLLQEQRQQQQLLLQQNHDERKSSVGMTSRSLDSGHGAGPSGASSHGSLYEAISPTTLGQTPPSRGFGLLSGEGVGVGLGLGFSLGVGLNTAPSPSSGAQTTRREFHRYAARVQTAMDVPVSSEVMAYATADMGIEAMLRWPLFRRKLRQLDLASEAPLASLLETPASGSEVVSVSLQTVSQLGSDALGRLHVQELVQNFLVNNNVKNPILDPAGLRKHTDVFVRAPLEYTGRNCLIFLVLAISCLSTKISDASLRRVSVSRTEVAFVQAEQYFQEAMRRVGTLLYVDSLLAAQCHFLVGVYLMHTLRILPAWKAFVLAGSNCVSYFVANGRIDAMPEPEPASGPSFGPSARQQADEPSTSTSRALEDALYWSCLKSEVELRLELGLPGSGINAVQYPHVFPCVPDMDSSHTELSVGHSTFLGTNQPEVDRTHLTYGWFFFLAEIALKRLMYSILQARYRLGMPVSPGGPPVPGRDGHEQPDAVDAAEYDLQLDQWLRLLPPAMQFPASSTEPLDDILPWVLRGHRIDAVELLRFPAFAAFLKEAAAAAAPPPSRLAREYLQNAASRIEANAYGVFHRHQGTWLTIRSCTRSALALLGTKLAIQEAAAAATTATATPTTPPDLLPPRWHDAVLLVQSMLRAWAPESRDVARLGVVVDGLLSLCD